MIQTKSAPKKTLNKKAGNRPRVICPFSKNFGIRVYSLSLSLSLSPIKPNASFFLELNRIDFIPCVYLIISVALNKRARKGPHLTKL